MKGLKFIESLKVTFEMPAGDKQVVVRTAYFNSQTQTIINQKEILVVLQLSKQQILNKVAQWISEGSGWMTSSVDDHYLSNNNNNNNNNNINNINNINNNKFTNNIVKYQPMQGSSYIQLPNELQNSSKAFINIKNDDNECFRWCHIRHMNSQDKDPQRTKKSDKEYLKKLDYAGIEFPIIIKQIKKIGKQNNISINVFGYEEKQMYPINRKL